MVRLPKDVRAWPHFVITVPVTAKGEGPATLAEADRLTWEVWDWSFETHGVFDNLPDALNLAIHLNTQGAGEPR
ncbi:hypothetical protein GGR19_001722 [Croceicoccus naphthovorans]|nr:hypothetical protein [Croceicoccus naphthovorans]